MEVDLIKWLARVFRERTCLHISAKNLLRTLIRRKPKDIAYRRKVIAPLNEIQCTQRCEKVGKRKLVLIASINWK